MLRGGLGALFGKGGMPAGMPADMGAAMKGLPKGVTPPGGMLPGLGGGSLPTDLSGLGKKK